MRHYFVVDIGGTEIKYGVINESGALVFKDKMPSRGTIGGKYILDDVIAVAKPLIEQYKTLGIAVSSAGVINSNTGLVLSATNSIIDFIGMNIVSYLENALNLPVSVMNDVKSMALCEAHLGAGKGAKLMIALTIGTGIGGAIVIDGKLLEGNGYSAGEFGLMQIESQTFEDIASTSALVKMAKNVLKDQVNNGVDVFNLYDQNNADAIKIVNQFYENLSIGLVNLIYAFNPELIVIGGGIASRKTFVDELNQKVFPRLNKHLQKYTKIEAANYKNDAGMIGAFYHFLSKYPQ